MRCFIFFIIILFSFVSVGAQDSPEYQGYRIYFSNPEVLSSKKKAFKIKFNATNTGSKEISKNQDSRGKIVFNLDESIQMSQVAQFIPLINEKLKSSSFSLKPGESKPLQYKIKIPKEQRGKEVFTVSTKGGGGTGFNRKLCPDLILDSLVLLKRESKFVHIEFQIVNKGKGAINIIGDKRNIEDNILVRAYFAGSPRFSRGAIPADEMYLKGLDETQGILFPNQRIKATMKVSRKKQTKYNKVMIVFVDANQIVMECNETNNRDHVLVK